jgi:hypothetical protein
MSEEKKDSSPDIHPDPAKQTEFDHKDDHARDTMAGANLDQAGLTPNRKAGILHGRAGLHLLETGIKQREQERADAEAERRKEESRMVADVLAETDPRKLRMQAAAKRTVDRLEEERKQTGDTGIY